MKLGLGLVQVLASDCYRQDRRSAKGRLEPIAARRVGCRHSSVRGALAVAGMSAVFCEDALWSEQPAMNTMAISNAAKKGWVVFISRLTWEYMRKFSHP